jgi:outer membrane protein assembly factor BamB
MVAVTTQHNDLGRTGANLQETQLKVSNVKPATFGKIFERQVDGQIYAQPLYVPHVAVANANPTNVVFVATMHNSVYAFDAEHPSVSQAFWHRSFEPPVTMPDPNIGFECHPYNDILGEIGILSTPVIDLATSTIYLVTMTRAGPAGSQQADIYQHWLHALDIATGAERANSPRRISAAVPTNSGGTLTFDSKCENQRPGLLLSQGRVYIGFASYCDSGPYHGWILSYDAQTLQPRGTFNVTPNGDAGGVWQSAYAPAADTDGNVYVLTGNGTFDAANGNFGDCLVKLDADLNLVDWFSPSNNDILSAQDLDLGSASPMFVPGTSLLLGGGKEGRLYLFDRAHLGHFNPAGDTQIAQSFQAIGVENASGVQAPKKDHHLHGTPVYWRGPGGARVYVWGESDWLRAYRFDGQRFPTQTGVAALAFKKILQNDTAIGAEALSSDGARLGLAWTGADPQQHLNFAFSADGTDFATHKTTLFTETSLDGPGLTFGGGRWFLAWTGPDAQTRVNIISSADGHVFDTKITFNESSPFGPALAFGNGRLFLAWVGTDANRSLNVMTFANPADLAQSGHKVTLPDQSGSAPGLSFIDGKLYLLWQGTDANRRLHLSSSTNNGATFGNRVVFNHTSDFHPALAKQGQFCLTWTGRSDRAINTLRGPSIQGLAHQRTFDEHASAAPTLTTHAGGMFVGWSGSDNPSHLNVAHVQPEPLASTGPTLVPDGMPGGMLSLSANGARAGSGVVWATVPLQGDANAGTVPGVLRAFDASDVSRELWNSRQDPLDDFGNLAKFCVPTIADGKVFIATFSGHLTVYGLK